MSALLGRIPSAVGYQPTLATDMGLLQERITSTGFGSITSVQGTYICILMFIFVIVYVYLYIYISSVGFGSIISVEG